MNNTIKNIYVFVLAMVAGSIINMLVLKVGLSLFPLPDTIDPNNMDSLAANIHLLRLENFIFVYLAHALGTLLAAYLAAKLSVHNHLLMALGTSIIFFIGGIFAVINIPAPLWFDLLDILTAYIPMGWIGWKLSRMPRK